MPLGFRIKTSYECHLSTPHVSNSIGVQREEELMSSGRWGRSLLGESLKDSPSRSVWIWTAGNADRWTFTVEAMGRMKQSKEVGKATD